MRFLISILIIVIVSTVILMPKNIKIGSLNFSRPQINIQVSNFKFTRDLEFKLGLDLQGGSHLAYEADMSKISPENRDAAMLATKENIDRRINLLGVSEPVIQTSKVGESYRLIVELPGVKNIQEALSTIGQTAQLEFREVSIASDSAQNATDSSQFIFVSTGLGGQDLKSATVDFGSGNTVSGKPAVAIQFTPEGSQKFTEITRRNIGRPLAIFLDENIVTAPTVQSEIVGSDAVITGEFSLEDAKRLSIQLNAGALPVPIKVVEQRNVGATLGSESVSKSLLAGLVGMLMIWVFMAVNYGKRGLVANVALTVYVLVSLSIFKLFPVTLTLAGIAGFILSVGMAVDANILIFERIKEELRWGRTLSAATELGFHRAWTSVRDSNISSLITASILFWFGSGSVRGFALTLIIGIFVSLFSSISVTRGMLRIISK